MRRDVVQRDEDLGARGLDDRRQRALPAHLLAAEGQPPAVEPARAAQRRVRGAARHQPRVEVAGVRGVERHGSRVREWRVRSAACPVAVQAAARAPEACARWRLRDAAAGAAPRTSPAAAAAVRDNGGGYVTRIVIIGGGPGGYEAALVAAQLGAEVTVVDCDGLGGASVLTDCVPSKTLIATAEVMTTFDSSYEELGIIVADDTPPHRTGPPGSSASTSARSTGA